MPQPTSESGLVGAIQRQVKKRWPQSWRFKVVGHPYQEAGIPDVLVCIDGLLFGLEAKFLRPGESREHAVERATPQQRVQIDKINRAGGIAGVVTSVAEAVELIEHGLNRRRNERQGQQEADLQEGRRPTAG